MKVFINAWLERRQPMIEVFQPTGESLFTLDSLQTQELLESGELCLKDLETTPFCDISFDEIVKVFSAN